MQEKETRRGGIESEKEKEKGVLARNSTRIMHTELGKHFRVIALNEMVRLPIPGSRAEQRRNRGEID